MKMKKVAVFLFVVCVIVGTTVGAYIAYKSQNTEPEEVLLSDLIPKQLDYESMPVNQLQAEKRAKDFLDKLGQEYDTITKTELLGNDMLSFWQISFDDYKYWIKINSKTGAVYDLITAYMIMGANIDNSYTKEYRDFYSDVREVAEEFVKTVPVKEGYYEEKIPYGKDIIVLSIYEGRLTETNVEFYQTLSNEEAKEYATEIFMKIPLEKNNYILEIKFERDEWCAHFKTKIDEFETRYKEIIIKFKDKTKQIVCMELNPEDIYDDNEVIVNKIDVEQLMDKYISNIKSKNTFKVINIRRGISYVDPQAINRFNTSFMLTENEIMELNKKELEKNQLMEEKLNDGSGLNDIESIIEKWVEIYGDDVRLMFFGGNVFRKVWYVDIEANIYVDGYMEGVYKLTIGIDATNKMIVFYGDIEDDEIRKPAKRAGGMGI